MGGFGQPVHVDGMEIPNIWQTGFITIPEQYLLLNVHWIFKTTKRSWTILTNFDTIGG